MRVWESEIGLSFNVKQDKCCIFCDHCSDIWYDSNGPYMLSCELNNKHEDDHNCDGDCDQFEEKGGSYGS